MKNFSFLEVNEKEAGDVVKSPEPCDWARKVYLEIAGEEARQTAKGNRNIREQRLRQEGIGRENAASKDENE